MSTMNTLIADLEAIPLADMTERDQQTFAAAIGHLRRLSVAIGHLRRLSDRVHTLEISQHRTAEKIDELERENARLREALKPFAWQTRVSSLTEEVLILNARAALARSGEK